jgi:hypothetical protein
VILGVGGDEVIYFLLDVMYAKVPYTVIQRAMHINPTVAEYLPTILGNLDRLRKRQSAWKENTENPILAISRRLQ